MRVFTKKSKGHTPIATKMKALFRSKGRRRASSGLLVQKVVDASGDEVLDTVVTPRGRHDDLDLNLQ